MIKKFNEISSAKEANKYIALAMNAYQKAKKSKAKPEMAISENLIIACGGVLQQAIYPSEFMFGFMEMIAPGATVRWQKRRDSAQIELEKAFGAHLS